MAMSSHKCLYWGLFVALGITGLAGCQEDDPDNTEENTSGDITPATGSDTVVIDDGTTAPSSINTDSGGDSDIREGSDTGTGGSGENSADVISGATPGVESALLKEDHDGWRQNNCFGCHADDHVINYSIGDCVSCHGKNGTPTRPLEHPDLGCEGCHVDQHPNLSLDVPEDCRACHAPGPATQGACAYNETYDVVVIGGGGGGLSAASVLARGGKKVLLVEQHYKVGGCMVSFTRGDYQFEASLHAYDGWGLSYLNALGIRDALEPQTGEIMFRLVYPDLSFDIPSDIDKYRDALMETFPHEAANIEDLFNNFHGAGPGYPGMNLVEAVQSHGIEDKKVIAIFTILAAFLAASPEGMPADAFIGAWESFYRMGYYYFTGGSQAITDELEKVILENGGVIKRHTRASSIDIADGKATGIRTEDGGCYSAGAVISNASAPATYLHLIGEAYLPAEVVEEVKTRTPAPSNLAVLFIGVDKDYTEYFPGGSHEIMMSSTYGRNDAEIDEVRCLPEAVDFMVTNYSVQDVEAAPPGKNAIVITADYIDYDCNNVWRFDESYDSYAEYKATLAEVLVARAEVLLPGLSEHIEVLEVASPKTVEQFTLSPRGSWAGWAFEPVTDSLIEGTVTTPVDGVFMAGSWIGGAGQSVALSTGIQAASAAQQYLQP